MAQKKSPTKKSKKTTHYPVVRGSFLTSTTENAAVRLFDTARALSASNRRLYRFSRVYPVSIGMVPTSDQTVEVYALRDDWAVHQGLKMAYKQYLKNTEDERKALGKDQVARWEDFRVDAGVTGSFNDMFAKLHAPDFTTDIIMNAGEFELSTVVDSSDTRRTFTWGTPSATEYGILQEYDLAANAETSPTDTTGSTGERVPYGEIDSENNELTSLDMQQHGDNPPYDRTGVNATSPWVKVATLGAGVAGQQRLSTGFFNAPCGLVVLVGNSAGWNSDNMMFEVQKGNYKGVGGMSLLE